MSQSNRPVTSREYKLMLHVERFKNRAEGSQAFWQLLEFLAQKQGGKIVERQNEEAQRRTHYLDTPGLALRQRGFILRLREEEGDAPGRFQINLKYRGADRYISAAQDVSTSNADGKSKFEEDIVPPFGSKFSHSTSIKADVLPELTEMSQVVALFPGLSTLNIPASDPVKTVNDFVAHEVAHKIGKIEFEEIPVVKAMLSFWYLLGEENEWPLVGEFSFDYDARQAEPGGSIKLEEYPLPAVAGANRFFSAVQSQSGWLNLNATTKTAFALDTL